MQYAHENGCPWNEQTCSDVAKNGHLNILQYAHENGCPWDELTCTNAAKNGHLHILQYAHENGCPWSKLTCTYAARFGFFLIFCSGQWKMAVLGMNGHARMPQEMAILNNAILVAI